MSEHEAPETDTTTDAPAEPSAESAAAPAADAPAADALARSDAEYDAGSDELADLDDIDFDLDEVESKIAPLALAHTERRTW
jgi:hypothetical protein